MIASELSAGKTVLSLLVHRYRKVYVVFPIYLAILAIVFRLPEKWMPDPLLVLLTAPFVVTFIGAVFGFVNADADIASTDSAYSPWLLRLPVKTSSLALWPMAAATVWAVGSWFLFSELCLRQRLPDTNVVWPAVCIAALALLLQAILWPPVKAGSLRLVLALLLPLAEAVFGIVADAYNWSALRITEVYGAAAICAAFAAYAGLLKARTSPRTASKTQESGIQTVPEANIRNTKKPFRSPEQAQFWLEWRMQGRILPIFTLVIMVLVSMGLLFDHDLSGYYALQGHDLVPTSGGIPDNAIRINMFVQSYLFLLPLIPLMLATLIGLGARPSSMQARDGAYHLYYATRPLTPGQMYSAKMRAIGFGSLLACTVTIITMLVWILVPTSIVGQRHVSYLSAILQTWDREVGPMMLIYIGVVFLGIWRNQAVGAFVDYLVWRNAATLYPLIIVVLGATEACLYQTLIPGNSAPIMRWLVLAVLCGWMLAKIGVFVLAYLKLRRLNSKTAGSIASTFGQWLVAGTFIAAAFWLITNVSGQNLYPALRHPALEILGFILVPVARPVIARLALETGRHR